jgi:hypothetical protein
MTLAQLIADLEQAGREIRCVLEEMAVVPNAYRARLVVALRLLDEARARLTTLNDER